MERSGSDRRPSGGGRSGDRPGGKPGGRPGGKPGARSDAKPGGRPGGRPGGKPGARSGSKPGGRPGGEPGGGQRGGRIDSRSASGERPMRSQSPTRPRGPAIPEDIDISELDPAVINELRTLPEDLQEKVAGHLLAAEWALAEDEVSAAREHAAEAKRVAGRVACVREAMGIVAYRCGDYSDALAELRAVRRMTGDDSFVPMMADCERGLGRPERALELLRELRTRDPEIKVEAAIVASGARSDLGQVDAALVLLEIPELTALPAGAQRARLEYAYASALAAGGRDDQAREWFAKAAASDIDQVTDAADHLT